MTLTHIRHAIVTISLVVLASVEQCIADSNNDDDGTTSSSAIDFTVIFVGAFVGLLIIVLGCRWYTRRRRDRSATTMAQAGPILPTIRLPCSSNMPTHIRPSHQSYLGENRSPSFNWARREPPPAYNGKEPLEGETVVSSDAPPRALQGTPPAYTTVPLSALPPAYMRSESIPENAQ
ncbi:hypothetical protein C8Q72DRAFT_819623 [Fomitopsis betulina]|nr:hypothetical protein C8Q72DRAFT_819623 [Fomitopsis betulina]